MELNMPNIGDSWNREIGEEFKKPYFAELWAFLVGQKAECRIFPESDLIFNAFKLCSFERVKVVILGQDPYQGSGKAHGLSFSVPQGVAIPPSLNNIYKEIKREFGDNMPATGDLSHWARQGVLLLNSILTVRENVAGSHRRKGWEIFTDEVIKVLSEKKNGLVFLLWGNFAKQKAELIDNTKHKILTAAHPSPLARGAFSGCAHFSKTNDFLREMGKGEIRWGEK